MLKDRPDGRKYSKVLRRSVSIADHIRANRTFTLKGVSFEVHSQKKFKEFWLERTQKQMSRSRIEDYLRYLITIKVFLPLPGDSNKYELSFGKPPNKQDYIPIFADFALEHLSKELGMGIDQTRDRIRKEITDHLDRKEVPTLNKVVSALGFSSGVSAERFKWSMYIYLDSPISPFDLKRNPFLEIL